jgi:hypothetical protein
MATVSELSSETHQRLSDPTLSFAAKLKLAASFELEYVRSHACGVNA